MHEELKEEPLLLHVERSRLRKFGHLVKITPGFLPGEMFQACPSGRKPQSRPGPSKEVVKVARERPEEPYFRWTERQIQSTFSHRTDKRMYSCV